MPTKTHVKFWPRSNVRIKSYGPVEPLLLPGATRPPPNRVLIPHPLYGKGHPETHVKFWSRCTVGSKVMARSNRYSCLARPDLLLTEYWFHIHYMEKRSPKTPVKFWSQSNSRIKSYGLVEPLLLLGATRPPPNRVWIPHPLYGKRASGNSCKI
jgi:hypothetical protein